MKENIVETTVRDDKVTGTAGLEGYSKMLRDQAKEEVDRIMNEIQGGYVEEVATPNIKPSNSTSDTTAPQQVMSQVSQISGYQSYEQGGDNLVIMLSVVNLNNHK